jgi:EAL domain-containing protein (putative c-di-GMP-specific phosphodiesterase class I)
MIGEVAKAAGLETVAEYVESASVLQLLATYGIDYAQGNYIGRAAPFPLEVVFDKWLLATQDSSEEQETGR